MNGEPVGSEHTDVGAYALGLLAVHADTPRSARATRSALSA